MDPKRILIVANQTLGGEALRREVKKRMAEGPCRFMLVVPATPPQDHAVWTEGEAYQLAHRRLVAALTAFREMGADVEGDVGDEVPMDAIDYAMLTGTYDEIVLSTLPPGGSRWLKQDLPHKIERKYAVPLTTVVSEGTPAPSG